MLFLGIDLAWGARATTGACGLWLPDLEERAQVASRVDNLGDDAAILDWISACVDRFGGDGILIGIDAPLDVPNQTGERPCDNAARRKFARFHAGPHPANRGLVGDPPRGERLVAELVKSGFALNAGLSGPRRVDMRQIMEVFPHPAHVVLFGLSRVIPYKAKRGRTTEMRCDALLDYGRLMRGLCDGSAMWQAVVESLEEIPRVDMPDDWPITTSDGDPGPLRAMTGKRRKEYEDGLDALTCAYVVYWYWWFGSDGACVMGDPAGHIVAPQIPSWLETLLDGAGDH